jgi:hypothetical protein
LLAEKELRKVLRAPADSTGSVVFSSRHGNWADRKPSGANPAASAEWTVDRAGRILIAAGALDEEFVHQVGSEIMAACTVRSGNRLIRVGMASQMFRPFAGTAPDLAAHPLRVVPIGQAFRLASKRAPADLHFMSLVSAARLAALCQRLGVPGPGPAIAAAARLPARWASVIAQRPAPETGPELFAPLATILPDLDGTRFALAGLSLTAGESYLHVVASGLPNLAERFGPGWRPGFSWWVRDGTGNWHLGVMAGRSDPSAGEAEFLLRLVPPLAVTPEEIEVLVGASSAAVRAVMPVRAALAMADT